MSRLRLACAASLALSAIGWVSAHALAYRLVAPDGHERLVLLEESGHAYLVYMPFVLALSVTLSLVFLAAFAVRGGGNRPAQSPPPALLGALPPFAFVIQEHLERLLHGADFATAAAEPTFLVGLVLQVPFALATLVAARLLLVVADALAQRIVDSSRPRVPPVVLTGSPADADLPRLAGLALGHGQRAPPVSQPS